MQRIELFWPNGKLKRQLTLQQGIRVGCDRMWNEEGVLVDEGFYDEMGNPAGVHQRYNDEGVLIEEIAYPQKNVRNWDPAGNLTFEAFWEDKTHYVERTFHPQVQERRGTLQGKDIVFTKTQATLPPPPQDSSCFSLSTYRENLQILMERFGKLGLLMPSFSYADRQQEGLRRLSLGSAQGVYVYGLGGGAPYFQLRAWLHADPDRKLIFLDDDPTSFVALLHFAQNSELLKDPQVHLEWLVDRTDDVERLSKQFPLHRVELFRTPSKDPKKFASLKTQVLRRTALSSALQTERIRGDIPFANFVRNVKHLPESFFANRLQNAFKGVPAIVCGAGPTLNAAIPYLKECSRSALIIAGGSAVAALSAQGVPIHFAMAVDPNLEEYRRFRNSFAFETPLLYSTRVHPSIFQTCNGSFGYMRSGIGGMLELWIEEALGLKTPLIGDDLPEEAISITSTAIAWALFLGCSSIAFSGVDLAYVGAQHYAAGVGAPPTEALHLLDEEKAAPDRILKGKNYKKETVMTATRWIMERSALSKMARSQKKTPFFNTSDQGLAIPKIPYLPFEEAKRLYFTREYDFKSLIQEQIAKAAMPSDAHETIARQLHALKQSLQRVIDHLEVLSHRRSGSAALAELEMADEEAFSLLLYDLKERFSSPPEEAWGKLLAAAKKYERSL